jgi:hypothetical protein
MREALRRSNGSSEAMAIQVVVGATGANNEVVDIYGTPFRIVVEGGIMGGTANPDMHSPELSKGCERLSATLQKYPIVAM